MTPNDEDGAALSSQEENKNCCELIEGIMTIQIPRRSVSETVSRPISL